MAKIYVSTKSCYDEDNSSLLPDFTAIEYDKATMKEVKKMVNEYIMSIRDSAEEHKTPGLYVYSLLAMNVLSQEYLKCYSPEYLKRVLEPTIIQPEK